MKKITLIFTLVLSAFFSRGQSAELQVIHNCADPAADSVDIYVNGGLAIDNFAFRNATGFITLPAGVPIEVGVAGKNSTSAADTLVNFSLVLANGERYVAVASGVLAPGNFAANPDGVNTGFNLNIKSGITASAASGSLVDLYVVHGSTDAPTVDVLPQSSNAILVDNAPYGAITDVLTVNNLSYILNVTPGNDNNTIVESYIADLTTLGGGTAVVFASGFLNPSANQNGAAFGLFAALSDGTVLELPTSFTSRLQIIHNSADPAAATVDVYVNGTIAFDDFAFRSATPFLDLPANTVLNIGIAPGSSTSVNDTLVNIPLTLDNGQTYVAIASGVLNPASFATNPDGRNTGFQLLVRSAVRESSANPANTDLLVLHGSTDAPSVDVVAIGVGVIVDNASYTDFAGYLSVPANSYLLNVTPANDNSVVVATYRADLSTLSAAAATVFASGFLDSTANQNGPAFGLYAALVDGTVLQLPLATDARIQLIHNCADPAADSVDIYINGIMYWDDFNYLEATPFAPIASGITLNIGIAPGNSSSVNDTLVNIPVTLNPGEKYLAVASGVLSPGSFASNPDGRNTGFQLLLRNDMRESSSSSSTVDLIVLHGCTDAPGVDVIARGVGTIVDNALYTDITNYLSVPNTAYTLDITPQNDNSVIVATFSADITTLGGGSAVVFASGFLDPSQNQNGNPFGLYAALTNGTVIPFSNTTSISEMANMVNGFVYPNPASSTLNIPLNDSYNTVTVRIADLAGRLVLTQTFNNASKMLQLNVGNLEQGTYTCTITSNGVTQSRRVMIAR